MKDTQLQIILFDALLYLLTFIYWANRLRKVNIGLVLLLIMTVSHIGAIFYYTVLYQLGDAPEFNAAPFIFLYAIIMMNFFPLLKFEGVRKIDVSGNEQLIHFLSIIIILLSLEPFLENLKILLTASADYSELYNDMREGYLNIYTSIGATLMGWSNHFKLFVTIAFFYYLSLEEKKKYIIIGLLICMINYILYWINQGGRGGILSQVLMYFFCFLLFVPIFNAEIIRRAKRWIIISLIPMAIYFVLITLSRYNSGDPDKSLIAWVLLYTSEGPIKFSGEMWDGEHNTNGDVNLCYLKSLLGLKTYTTFEERDEHYLSKNGRRIEVFYTYIGDFVSDFDIWGALIVGILLTIFTKRLLGKDGVIPFRDLLFLLFIIHMYSIGFASNIYRSNNLQKGVFYLFIVYLVMAYLSNSHKSLDTSFDEEKKNSK